MQNLWLGTVSPASIRILKKISGSAQRAEACIEFGKRRCAPRWKISTCGLCTRISIVQSGSAVQKDCISTRKIDGIKSPLKTAFWIRKFLQLPEIIPAQSGWAQEKGLTRFKKEAFRILPFPMD